MKHHDASQPGLPLMSAPHLRMLKAPTRLPQGKAFDAPQDLLIHC